VLPGVLQRRPILSLAGRGAPSVLRGIAQAGGRHPCPVMAPAYSSEMPVRSIWRPFSGDVGVRRSGFRCVAANKRDGILGRHGAAVQIALPLLTSFLLQGDRLRRFFHAFGGHGQSKPAAKSKQGAHQRLSFGLTIHAVDEAAVDLDLVDLEIAQMVKARIAGAEIVERDAHAGAAQSRQRLLRAFEVMHDG
jgi:hypothetical protein